MAKFTFHNSGESSYFTLETIPRPITGLYPTSSTQINFISGSGFSDVTSSVENPFVENDFKWSVVLPPGTSSFVWPSGSTENATTVPASESKMASTGEGTVTIGDTIFNLQDLTSFTFAPELTPGSGGGGGSLATASNAFSMAFSVDDKINTGVIDLGSQYTISFWFKNDSTNNKVPLGKSNDYIIFMFSSGLYWKWSNSTSNGFMESLTGITSLTNAIADTTNFHHLALVRSVATSGASDYTDLEVYLDGISIFTEINHYSAALPLDNFQYIGDSGGSSYPYDGSLDEIALFTSSLDASTVESIYSASLPLGSNVTADLSALSTPPVAWYRMGD